MVRPMSKGREFWCISNSTLDPKSRVKRWEVSFDFDRTSATIDELRQVQFDDGPVRVREFVAEANRRSTIEDVPDVCTGPFIVSDRVRYILIEADPGGCQFIPVDVQYRRKSLGLSYWAV